MTYSKYFLPQSAKVPIPVTIAIIVLLIFFITRFFTSKPLPSRATDKKINGLRLVNVSYNQFGIFWQTDKPETGWVIYGPNQSDLSTTVSDERDVQSQKNLYHNHLVMLKNLNPDTEYFYKIVSDSQLVEATTGTAFSFKTPATFTASTGSNPAYGKVIKENGEPLSDAVVMVLPDNSFPLVALSKSTGEWLIPLNSVLNRDTLKTDVFSGDKILIEILSEDDKKTVIQTNLSNISPVPQTLIIGKDYNFLNQADVLPAATSNKSGTGKIEILFPKESAIIPAGRPLIKGTAIPGGEVEVSLEGEKNYTFKTKADRDGVWTVVVKEPLSQGTHILNVHASGANGKVVTLTREFNIAKSGEQVLAAATPDATIEPTEIPVTADPTIFVSPTIFFTPGASQYPTVSISPPVSGNSPLPFAIASASLIILGLGILLAF